MIILIIVLMLFISCAPQEKAQTAEANELIIQTKESQIAQYVTSVYQDSKDNLWFGTIQKGIARYDGRVLKYFTTEDGLPTDRATGIIEDEHGILWIKTGAGLSKFDGERFIDFPVSDDFSSNMISASIIDSKGTFWVGTWGGVYIFNGKTFEQFPIPYPEITTTINQDTKNWITEIKEDLNGNIWFGRDGYGACKYDGESFTHVLKKDGLHSNNITEIEFDKDGSIWFGTRVAEKDDPDPLKRIGKGGINKWTKEGMISFPETEGFNNGDVYEIYKDQLNNIWIGTIKSGVYRFDGIEFKQYDIPISAMSITSDKKGNLWLAGAGGLYRINPKGELQNITTNGPWE